MEWKTYTGWQWMLASVLALLLSACDRDLTDDTASTHKQETMVVASTDAAAQTSDHSPAVDELASKDEHAEPAREPLMARPPANDGDLNARLAIVVVNDNQEPVSGAMVDVLDEDNNLVFSGQADPFGLLYLVPAIDLSGHASMNHLVARATDPFNNQASGHQLIVLGEGQLTLVLGGAAQLSSSLKRLFAMGSRKPVITDEP